MFIKIEKLKKLHELIKLDKPLVVFDMETTGLSISQDKIIAFAYIKIWQGGKIKKNEMLLNPEIRITLEATAVHSIRDKDVREKPKFREKAQELWDVFNDCYYGGYNIMNFDLPVLRREFIRVGMDFSYKSSQIIDSKAIFHYMVPRTLGNAYEYYCRKKFKETHRPMVNSEIIAEILVKQLARYNEARDWSFINNIHQAGDEIGIDNKSKFYWQNGEAYFAFSKYKDRPLAHIARDDPNFLKWILSADFSDETKAIVKKAIEGRGAKK